MANATNQQTFGIFFIIALITGTLSGVVISMFITADDDDEPEKEGSDLTFTLEAYITGYVGVGGEIDGLVNPQLNVTIGDSVTLILKAGEAVSHDIAIDEFNVDSELVATSGDFPSEVQVTFEVNKNGEFFYYCTVAGHRALGMEGKIVSGLTVLPDPAKPVDVLSIVRDASDVGIPVGNRVTPTTLEYTIVSNEVTAYIEEGVTFTYWTYNSTVPGPLLRAMVGDTIIITLQNNATSSQEHSIDLHAVTGPGGGAQQNDGNGTANGGPSGILRAAPGASSSFTFVATHEGSFVYHCASPHIPTHISKGMFGAVIIEPVGGLPPVDKEFYIGQNEVYTKFAPGIPGHNEFDDQSMFHEDPNYVLFNGAVAGLTGAKALNADLNDNIRIFFGVGGPNLISSFHMIGEIWDFVWYETTGDPMINAETVLVAPGSVLMVELVVEVAGAFIIVDHALSRVFDKGCLAILQVT